MSIVGAFIVPHPPIILPGVGKGEEKDIQKTIDAYRKVAQCIADFKPCLLYTSIPVAQAVKEIFGGVFTLVRIVGIAFFSKIKRHGNHRNAQFLHQFYRKVRTCIRYNLVLAH